MAPKPHPQVDPETVTMEQIESNIVRCPDQDVAEQMIERIDRCSGQHRGFLLGFHGVLCGFLLS